MDWYKILKERKEIEMCIEWLFLCFSLESYVFRVCLIILVTLRVLIKS